MNRAKCGGLQTEMPKRTSKTKKKRSPAEGKPAVAHQIRLRMVAGVLVVCFGLIAARLIQFQVDTDQRFMEVAMGHIGATTIERPRGTIYDANGRPLATNRNIPSLYVNPSYVINPDALVAYLAPRTDLEIADIRERITRKNAQGELKKEVVLQRRLDPVQFSRLNDVEDSGEAKALYFKNEILRYYPEKDLAAQIIGFSQYGGHGAEGIEAYCDEYLYGVNGEMGIRVDSRGRVIEVDSESRQDPSGGDDVILTIDSQIQFRLERELDAAMEQHNARGAMGIMMDPHTGAIIAMATRPAFDPNNAGNTDPALRKNRAVLDIFEPGSAFKIVTAAAVLEQGLVTPNTLIDCMNGRFRPVKRRVITDTHPLGVVPFSETFAQSSNIAIIKVAALLGDRELDSWIRRFGFGAKTRLEVPYESKGLFRTLDQWSGYSMSSLPMGHEISVTMPQLAQAFSVIANGGLLVKPHMIEKTRSQSGETTFEYDGEESLRVISESTAATMRDLAYQVVYNEDGTGTYAAIPEYRVGGKTGTAQVSDPINGGYYDDRYTAVFAGFAPVNDPKVTCVIVIQEPMGKRYYGGSVAGPVFSEVVREALVRMNVPEDPMPRDFLERKKFRMARAEKHKEIPLFSDALDVFEPSMMDEPLDRMELTASESSGDLSGAVLPDFIGLTKRQARLKLLELGIDWEPQGAGRVVTQIPAKGTRLADVGVCKLIFGTRGKPDDA